MVFTLSSNNSPAGTQTTTTKTTTTYTSSSGPSFVTGGPSYVTTTGAPFISTTTRPIGTFPVGSSYTTASYTSVNGQPVFTEAIPMPTVITGTPGASYQYTSNISSYPGILPGTTSFPSISIFRPTATRTTTTVPITFGRISTAPLLPLGVARANRMALISPAGAQLSPELASSRQASSATFESSSSLTINGVQCAGHMAISNNKIIQAKNLFAGVAPFVLNAETLEVAPDMTVIVRNPEVRVHIPDLPCAEHESLTLANLRELTGAQGEVYVCLPGEESKILREENGALVPH